MPSALVPVFGWDVELLRDLADIPNSLPVPKLPDLGLLPSLIVPAAALAFIGLVQGAGVSASFPRPDGTPADASRDFVGQGAANIGAGALQGMPVGGSMSGPGLWRTDTLLRAHADARAWVVAHVELRR